MSSTKQLDVRAVKCVRPESVLIPGSSSWVLLVNAAAFLMAERNSWHHSHFQISFYDEGDDKNKNKSKNQSADDQEIPTNHGENEREKQEIQKPRLKHSVS